MLSIGEFSRATGLTVKTLRFYHEQGILVPSQVDSGSGYRFYAESKIESARIISTLRELDFSLVEIAEILQQHDDDQSIVAFLQAKRTTLQDRMKADRKIVQHLNAILRQQQLTEKNMTTANFTVQRKTLEPLQVASLMMQGKYSDCGTGFAQIGKKFGRYICGKPMLLQHDSEYRENDANFEPAMPVRQGKSQGELVVKELPGGECLSLMHQGPYTELHRTYATLIEFAQEHNFPFQIPTREIYHKGPGMIFRGNPNKYLTEVQFLRADTA